MADPELGASREAEGEETWAGDFDPFSDPEERRVLFAAFDSFRCVRPDENEDLAFLVLFWLSQSSHSWQTFLAHFISSRADLTATVNIGAQHIKTLRIAGGELSTPCPRHIGRCSQSHLSLSWTPSTR